MTELFTPSPENKANPYRVLARKYRPAKLAELIGQEAMVRTLTGAFHAGRLPQAWMLTGVRGVGKTTTARIIAKALNCTGRAPGETNIEPCGVCETCRAIAEDRHVDVLEMDAASRTGVDDIRDIIESVRYAPAAATYKIYILDEVHMLSKSAFNALLKTLEEPPPHAKFIFATTEIRKVPVTVLSRCQRFDLRRIESAQLAEHFARIAELEQVEAQAEAIKLIARAADGSVRDGLSLLDQAIARGDGKIIEADVKDMLGLADRAASLGLCSSLLRGEIAAAIESYNAMLQVGVDPLQIVHDLADLVHRLTRAQVLTQTAGAADMPEGERQLITDLSDLKVPALTRAWQILLKGVQEIQIAPNPAVAAEMVLVRLAYAAQLPLPGDLIKKLREQKEASTASAGQSTGPGGGGGGISGARGSRVTTASGAGAARVIQSTPVVATVQAEKKMPAPTNYVELVKLFAENREGGLYAELASRAHLVRLVPGQLTVRLDPGASPHLVGRVGQCLTQWTGQRWVVAVTDEPGEPTLAEQDRERERQRQERAMAHPLMQAVKQAFPEANLISLEQKQVATIPLSGDDAPPDYAPDGEDDVGDQDNE